MSEPKLEAWLRGPMAGVDPHLAPILYSLQMAREDLSTWTESLTDEQVWARPYGVTAIGFQLKHIAGSIDRLLTYLLGRQLDETQTAALREETEPARERKEVLLAWVNESLARAEEVVRSLDSRTLTEPRAVGRKQLPTTVIGLLVHMAEHTQRHVGETIMAAKLARPARTAGA